MLYYNCGIFSEMAQGSPTTHSLSRFIYDMHGSFAKIFVNWRPDLIIDNNESEPTKKLGSKFRPILNEASKT